MENKYNFFLGTSRGTILQTSCAAKEKIKFEKSEEPSETTALSFGRSDDEIVVGYRNGKVALYSIAQNKFVKKVKKLEGSAAIIGIGTIDDTLVIGRHDGIINIVHKKSRDYFSLVLDEKGTLDCLAVHKSKENIIGLGGEFNDFKLYDIESKTCVFKAKSMGHDELNLPIPTSIRGITFFEEDNLSAVATKEGHILLYDSRAQRRPVVKYFEKKASFTSIASAFRERQCFVGTTRGYMQLLDMKTAKCLKTFTSFTGSVTSISCDPVEPYVATTCLDRHLRIHNIETKELVHKAYLKQNLTRMLMRLSVKEEKDVKDDGEEAIQKFVEPVEDEEYEDLFNNMETIDEGNVEKQKRKVEDGETVKRKSKKKKIKSQG